MSRFTDLIQTFAYTFFALVVNHVFITFYEMYAREKTGAAAAPEDERLLYRNKLAGVQVPVAASVPANPGAAPVPVAVGGAPYPGGAAAYPGGAAGYGGGAYGAPVGNVYALTNTAVKPETLARGNNAHANATENFVPYIIAVVPYIFAVSMQARDDRDDLLPVIILMSIFTFFRWCHTLCYLAGLQPFRTISWAISFIALVIISCYSVVAASKLSDDL